MCEVEELRKEYDRLSDQGRDTSEITAQLDALMKDNWMHKIYSHTTEIVRKLRHTEKVQHRGFQAAGLMELWEMREKFVKAYSWAIPTAEVVALIRNRLFDLHVGSVLDVGCGKALWPALINQYHGFDVVAYDPKPQTNPYMPVVSTLPEGTFDCLSFVWPEYDRPWAWWALKAKKPRVVLYIGESGGGCTADENFHAELDKEYERNLFSMLPNWPSIHDDIYIYTRRES
jgi:hypothetical protein